MVHQLQHSKAHDAFDFALGAAEQASIWSHMSCAMSRNYSGVNCA
jgi:hypothetical protein